VDDNITNILGPLIFTTLLEIFEIITVGIT